MTGLIPREESALVVVDIQEKLFPAIFNKEKVLANSIKVIEFCNRLDIPIIVTEQYPQGLGATLPEVRQVLGDAYRPIPKTAFSCFGEPKFIEKVLALGRPWLVLVGIETHVCVAQTAINALNFFLEPKDGGEEIEFSICLLRDCVGSRTEEFHLAGEARLRDDGAIISTSDAFFYEMLVEAKTMDHKKVFDLLK